MGPGEAPRGACGSRHLEGDLGYADQDAGHARSECPADEDPAIHFDPSHVYWPCLYVPNEQWDRDEPCGQVKPQRRADAHAEPDPARVEESEENPRQDENAEHDRDPTAVQPSFHSGTNRCAGLGRCQEQRHEPKDGVKDSPHPSDLGSGSPRDDPRCQRCRQRNCQQQVHLRRSQARDPA